MNWKSPPGADHHHQKKSKNDLDEIAKIISIYSVEKIIIGYPINLTAVRVSNVKNQ